MQVHELAEGLWRWTAPHPDWAPGKDWPQSVASIYREGEDAIVLIDPLAPPAGTADAEKFWAALDRDVDRAGRPVVVLVGNVYHTRSAREVYRRYAGHSGAELHVAAEIRDRVAFEPTHTFVDADVLPAGVVAHRIDGLDDGEFAFHLTDRRSLVLADAIVGAGNGRARVAPESWGNTAEGRRHYRERFRDSLARLLELDFERLLPSHGEPVLAGGRDALAAALRAPAWGE